MHTVAMMNYKMHTHIKAQVNISMKHDIDKAIKGNATPI
jgi:hypothetical protein